MFSAAGSGVGDPFELQRFVEAQDRGGVYEQALGELRAGRKRSHWIWFVFPQIAGLGFSAMSRMYAISSLEEAAAYLSHPVLGPRLAECCEALLALPGDDPVAVLGEVDALKLRSSMTLFSRVGGGPAGPAGGGDAPGVRRDAPGAGGDAAAVCREVLARYYGGVADAATERLLR